jgi:hypothetical protein
VGRQEGVGGAILRDEEAETFLVGLDGPDELASRGGMGGATMAMGAMTLLARMPVAAVALGGAPALGVLVLPLAVGAMASLFPPAGMAILLGML